MPRFPYQEHIVGSASKAPFSRRHSWLIGSRLAAGAHESATLPSAFRRALVKLQGFHASPARFSLRALEKRPGALLLNKQKACQGLYIVGGVLSLLGPPRLSWKPSQPAATGKLDLELGGACGSCTLAKGTSKQTYNGQVFDEAEAMVSAARVSCSFCLAATNVCNLARIPMMCKHVVDSRNHLSCTHSCIVHLHTLFYIACSTQQVLLESTNTLKCEDWFQAVDI